MCKNPELLGWIKHSRYISNRVRVRDKELFLLLKFRSAADLAKSSDGMGEGGAGHLEGGGCVVIGKAERGT
jgi:hypothetical protein